MTNPSTPTPDSADQSAVAGAIERDLALLPEGPWELATSCSFRRISQRHGKDGGVLHAYKQRSDGHPDLSMPEEQLFALVRVFNALPDLIANHAVQALRIKALEDGLRWAKSAGRLFYSRRIPSQNGEYCDGVDHINALLGSTEGRK